jgi:hypothetical protein
MAVWFGRFGSTKEDSVSEISTATTTGEVVDGYFAMWNEEDAARRRAAIAAAWAPDGEYVDPLFAAAGHEGLDALAAGVQAQFPGHRFRLVGAVDAHHDRARWDWELVGPDGAPAAAGVDFAVLAPDGRLRAVTGFFAASAGA